MNGAELIARERERQLEKKGWTLEHDDEHRIGQLADAASAYIWAAHRAPMSALAPPPPLWPFEDEAWKPNDDPIRDLEKAGALIAAEIDRQLRHREHIIEGSGSRGRGRSGTTSGRRTRSTRPSPRRTGTSATSCPCNWR